MAGVLLLACEELTGDQEGAIVMQAPGGSDTFYELVSHIELIPICEDSEHLLGSDVSMIKVNDGYIIMDKINSRVYHYSEDGFFLNEVGRRGNGPSEHLSISNVQSSNDTVIVFGLPGKATFYSLKGDYIDEQNASEYSFYSEFVDGGVLTYYGYQGSGEHRLVYRTLDSGKSDIHFLKTRKRVMNLSLGNKVFSECHDGGTLVLDSFSSSIYCFQNNSIYEYERFDFGRYSIPAAFFEYKDVHKGAEFLLSSHFAVIYSYIENDSKKIVQVNINKGNENEARYGYFDGDSWNWFSFDSGYSSSTNGPFQFFSGDVLYGLFEFSKMDKHLKKLVEAAFDKQNVENEYFIAKLYLD